MSLRGYVKQLRPIQENYIKPDDKTQLFLLSEAKMLKNQLEQK